MIGFSCPAGFLALIVALAATPGLATSHGGGASGTRQKNAAVARYSYAQVKAKLKPLKSLGGTGERYGDLKTELAAAGQS
jgi:hypothetical protein